MEMNGSLGDGIWAMQKGINGERRNALMEEELSEVEV